MLLSWRAKRALYATALVILTIVYFYLFFAQKIPGAFIHLSYVVFSLVFTMIVCCHNKTQAPDPPIAHSETLAPATLPRYPSFASYSSNVTLTEPLPVYIPLSDYKQPESPVRSPPNVFSAP